MIDPEIYARMLALTERLARGRTNDWVHEEEAKKIMALVTPDPDWEVLKPMFSDHGVLYFPTREKTPCTYTAAHGMYAALQLGRELAKAEQSTEAVDLLRRAVRFVRDTLLYEEIIPFLARHDKEQGA